ncbi:Golgi phosphoprotein 3 (GPP34) [Nocardioides scoriae]|uniref:Golgi phosphoprotein 3 (GPP34) n=1 Tax=Nocardioides scoriae TaxID=642780 RepID=A0A1H1LRT4_9ACTN|nr:GPP34 family phosphoprotein [Nocardioides scoriae]SDR77042.1 Golgi phosphoprotein 3 (GPP34) [Nocardioides scoriae]
MDAVTTLIAEDLLLLLLDDESGKLSHATYLDVGLGGALLVDLALGEHVDVDAPGRKWGFTQPGRVRVTGSLPGDPALRAAYDKVAEKERTAQDLVGRLGRKQRDPLLERLAGRGLVERREDKVLGLFPTTRWPAADARHEEHVRRALEATLLRGDRPDPRTGALVALLHGLGVAHRVVERGDVGAGEVKKRAKAVAEGDWAAKGVADAVAAAQAAMVAAMAATTAATAATSS